VNWKRCSIVSQACCAPKAGRSEDLLNTGEKPEMLQARLRFPLEDPFDAFRDGSVSSLVKGAKVRIWSQCI
jgi:hypothetical protein